MKKYKVTTSYTAYDVFEVEAENEQEAEAKVENDVSEHKLLETFYSDEYEVIGGNTEEITN